MPSSIFSGAMFLLRLHLPLISAGYFGAVIGQMLDFVSMRIRRSDQGMTPSLSPGLRAQTVALHRRLTMLAGEFQRLARLARDGRLRVYPDRASPAARPETTDVRAPGALYSRPDPTLPFGPARSAVHGATLPALSTRGFGWMLGFVPATYREAVAGPLRNPEMVTLIQASPTVARLLRSLCHGLGVTRPEGVFPAQHRRRSRAAPRSHCGEGVDLDCGTVPGGAVSQTAPRIVMSAQARDRWWAEHRRFVCSEDNAPGAGQETGASDFRDTPMPIRCAKR